MDKTVLTEENVRIFLGQDHRSGKSSLFILARLLCSRNYFFRSPPKTRTETVNLGSMPVSGTVQPCVSLTLALIHFLFKPKALVHTPKVAEDGLKCLLCFFLHNKSPSSTLHQHHLFTGHVGAMAGPDIWTTGV
jgi:hypothetical protein